MTRQTKKKVVLWRASQIYYLLKSIRKELKLIVRKLNLDYHKCSHQMKHCMGWVNSTNFDRTCCSVFQILKASREDPILNNKNCTPPKCVSFFSGETEEVEVGGWAGRAEMVFWKVHLSSMRIRGFYFFPNFFQFEKNSLWKVSYEECSLFETSTTQMPILSRIESLAVHINTFQAQIKKCKQNKKIYIYIIFPYPKVSSLNAANPSEHRIWGAHCSFGTNGSLQRLLPS